MGCTDSKPEPKKPEPPVEAKKTPPVSEKKPEEPPANKKPDPSPPSSPSPPRSEQQQQPPLTKNHEPNSPILPSPSQSPAPKPKIFAFFPGAGGAIDIMRPILDSNPQEEKNDLESVINKYLSHVGFIQGFEGDRAHSVSDEELEQIIADTPAAVLENISLIDISGCDKLTLPGIAKLFDSCSKNKIRAIYAFPLPACLSSKNADNDISITDQVTAMFSELKSLSIIFAYDAQHHQHPHHQHPLLNIALQLTTLNRKSALNWTTLSNAVSSLSSSTNENNNNNNNNNNKLSYELFEPTIVIDGKSYTEMDCLFEAIELNKPLESGRAWYDLGVLIAHQNQNQQQYLNNNNNNINNNNSSNNDFAEINSVSMMMMNASCTFGGALSPASNSGALGGPSPRQNEIVSPSRGAIAAGPGGPRPIPTVERNDVVRSSRECFIKSIECDPTCSYSWVGLGIDLLTYAPSISFDDKNNNNNNIDDVINRGNSSLRLAKTMVSIRLGNNNNNNNSNNQTTTIRVNAKECFVRSLTLHNDNAFAWANLGNLLRVPLTVLSETQKLQVPQDDFDCYDELTYARINIKKNNGDDAAAVVYEEKDFSKIDCYIRCLELDPSRIKTWNNLGAALGACGAEATAVIRGQTYSKRDCLVRSIELSRGKDFATWMNLAALLSANETDSVNGVQSIPQLLEKDSVKCYTKKDCLIEALKINPELKPAWKSLAMLVVLNPDGTSTGAADPASLTKETITIGETTYTKLEVLRKGV